MPDVRYARELPSNPPMAALALAIGLGLGWGAGVVEDAPAFVLVILWIIAVLASLAGLGALIGTSVAVDASGDFELSRRFAGIPVGGHRIPAQDIVAVEVDRRMSPGGMHREMDTAGPGKPRYRVSLVHRHGRIFIDASGKRPGLDPDSLAKAVGRPLRKTGDWTA